MTAAASASLLRLASPLILGRGASAFLTLLLPVVLVRRLSPHDYGTYKQFFLVAATGYLAGQVGLPASLYYFLPRREACGRYLVQTLGAVFFLGTLGAALLVISAPELATRFANPTLRDLALPLALYVWAQLASTPLEPSLTASGRTGWAGLAYAVSDATRALALLFAIALGLGLVGLAWAAVFLSVARLVTTWVLLLTGRLATPQKPSLATVRAQLFYALPLGAAVLVSVAQLQLPQYTVAALTDASTYAVFAIGATQIPFTDLLYTPVADIMMVRLSTAPRKDAPAILHEAVSRLLVFFLPLLAFAWAVAPELIPTLYTERYAAATPLFLIAVAEVALSALPIDALLRALGATGTLLGVNALRLAFGAVAVPSGLLLAGLPGAMVGTLATQCFGKALVLRCAAQKLGVSVGRLVPWRTALAWAFRSMVIFFLMALLRFYGPLRGWLFLGVASLLSFLLWLLLLFRSRDFKTGRAPAKIRSMSEGSLG